MGLLDVGYTSFLYDRYISAFAPGVCCFVPGRYEYLTGDGMCLGCSIAISIVILRYEAGGLSGG